jgi:hypothetical protein
MRTTLTQIPNVIHIHVCSPSWYSNAVFKSRESLDLIKEVAMECPVAVKMIGEVTQCVKQNLPKYHKAFIAYQLLP